MVIESGKLSQSNETLKSGRHKCSKSYLVDDVINTWINDVKAIFLMSFYEPTLKLSVFLKKTFIFGKCLGFFCNIENSLF